MTIILRVAGKPAEAQRAVEAAALLGPVSVCAWCPDKDARTAAALAEGREVTHGCCPSCSAAFRADGGSR